jgi:hypothetical protein
MKRYKHNISTEVVKVIMFISMISFCLPFVGNSQTKDVKSLIKQLKNESSQARSEVINALVEIGEPAVKPLISALKDKDSNVKNGAAEALGRIGDIRAVNPLIDALNKDPDVRFSAILALGQIKDAKAVNTLIDAIKAEDFHIRATAAKALGYTRDTVAVSLLINALKDESPDVRREAAAALGSKKDSRAVGTLINIFKYGSSDDRKWAAAALIKIGTPGVEPFANALKETTSEILTEVGLALLDLDINDAERVLTLSDIPWPSVVRRQYYLKNASIYDLIALSKIDSMQIVLLVWNKLIAENPARDKAIGDITENFIPKLLKQLSTKTSVQLQCFELAIDMIWNLRSKQVWTTESTSNGTTFINASDEVIFSHAGNELVIPISYRRLSGSGVVSFDLRISCDENTCACFK